jgi:hypothetical protein
MRARLEVYMTAHGTPPARPTAAWISRYAAALLSATPNLRPLDAVRLAMDASEGDAAGRICEPSKRTAHPRGSKR